MTVQYLPLYSIKHIKLLQKLSYDYYRPETTVTLQTSLAHFCQVPLGSAKDKATLKATKQLFDQPLRLYHESATYLPKFEQLSAPGLVNDTVQEGSL